MRKGFVAFGVALFSVVVILAAAASVIPSKLTEACPLPKMGRFAVGDPTCKQVMERRADMTALRLQAEKFALGHYSPKAFVSFAAPSGGTQFVQVDEQDAEKTAAAFRAKGKVATILYREERE